VKPDPGSCAFFKNRVVYSCGLKLVGVNHRQGLCVGAMCCAVPVELNLVSEEGVSLAQFNNGLLRCSSVQPGIFTP